MSFKPDDSLVQIRIFEHDPDEELGHDDNMVRDANDIKGEGQMLKRHRERDVMDDDDDAEATEESLSPWTAPSCKSPASNIATKLMCLKWWISVSYHPKSLIEILLHVEGS